MEHTLTQRRPTNYMLADLSVANEQLHVKKRGGAHLGQQRLFELGSRSIGAVTPLLSQRSY